MLLHSTRLPTSIFKRTAVYIHIYHPLSLAPLAASPQLLPSSSKLPTEPSWLSSEQQPKGCHRHWRMGTNSRSHFPYSYVYSPPHMHNMYLEAILCTYRSGRPRSPGSCSKPQWIKDLVHKDTKYLSPSLALQACPPIHRTESLYLYNYFQLKRKKWVGKISS